MLLDPRIQRDLLGQMHRQAGIETGQPNRDLPVELRRSFH